MHNRSHDTSAEYIATVTKTAFHHLLSEYDRTGVIPNLFYSKQAEGEVMSYCLRFNENYQRLTTNACLFECADGQYLFDSTTFFATEAQSLDTPGMIGKPLFELLPVPVNNGYQLQLPIETDNIHEALRLSLELYAEHWDSIVKHVATGKDYGEV